MPGTPHRFDALVIGGGPAGSTAALLLARAGWSVAVVEQTPFPRRKVCGEFLSATNGPLLRELGVSAAFLELAGPDVRRVGLFGAGRAIVADMPRLRGDAEQWGRALGRDQLDTLLLNQAAGGGASVWQPWAVTALERITGRGSETSFRCHVRSAKAHRVEQVQVQARIVIAAHGSWEPGRLPTQPNRRPARPSDLLGFKAHFLDTGLPSDLMPLLVFPGGYGGAVHTDHGRVSLSCCVRRDQLERCRRAAGQCSAGDAVLQHMKASCSALRDVLAGAKQDGDWQAAGPIRPGVRSTWHEGVFRIGNAAGEAHPAVAEGISMAMQSAWMLAGHLVRSANLAEVRSAYAAEWRRTFAPRIHASTVIARWAMDPTAVRLTLPLFKAFPALLTQSARAAGKVAALRVSPVTRS